MRGAMSPEVRPIRGARWRRPPVQLLGLCINSDAP